MVVEARFVALQKARVDGSTLSKGCEIQMAAHAREQQRADMQLQREFTRQNECTQFIGRHQFELNAVVEDIVIVV